MLLNEASATGEKKIHTQSHRQEELTTAQTCAENLLKESLRKLEKEEADKQSFMRRNLVPVGNLQDHKNLTRRKSKVLRRKRRRWRSKQ
jgi:protein TIF31